MTPAICVIHLSEDEKVVERLVRLLRTRWEVWWARDITHGDWEEAVRSAIPHALAVVPVLSRHMKGERKTILKDEMRLAKECDRPILPFLIGPAEVPLGFGDLNRVEAIDWSGDETDERFQRLQNKLAAVIRCGAAMGTAPWRPKEILLRDKSLLLPAFVFSLSSHETQVTPDDGGRLLGLLAPDAALVSAYDAARAKRGRERALGTATVDALRKAQTVLFLDSGNYEAFRKNDRYSSGKNPAGWQKAQYREIAGRLSPDVAFSFDTIDQTGAPDDVVERTVAAFRADCRALSSRDFPLCPIVHLPQDWSGELDVCAARIVSGVASELDPPLVAIPERELGDGLLARALTVRAIRRALNSLEKYYPLHLLGTGNPLSMIAFASAGADAFDGLEWCRTVANNEDGRLYHFQQFDCFSQACLYRVQSPAVRILLEDHRVPYAVKALSCNVDFFQESMRSLRGMIHSGQVETLLKAIPGIGPALYKELAA